VGYYIQIRGNTGKAKAIAELYNGEIVNYQAAKLAMNDPTKGVICVLYNPIMEFEAAGFCFSMAEFEEFTRPGDQRPKQFVIISREDAKRLTNYKGD
jgi:hypothetical protein